MKIDEDAFKQAAGLLIIVWAYLLAIFWLIVTVISIGAGGGLADIPGGLAAVITALTAGAGWNSYVSFRERHP